MGKTYSEDPVEHSSVLERHDGWIVRAAVPTARPVISILVAAGEHWRQRHLTAAGPGGPSPLGTSAEGPRQLAIVPEFLWKQQRFLSLRFLKNSNTD